MTEIPSRPDSSEFNNVQDAAKWGGFWGGEGRDLLTGSGAAEQFTGGGGADFVDAGGGNDRIYAGSGNDTVLAGDGDDFVTGDDGDDWLEGGAGRDTVYAGSGDDTLSGGAGDGDVLSGGSGADTYIIRQGDGGDFIEGLNRYEGDKLDLREFASILGDIDSFEKLMASGRVTGTAQWGGDTIIRLTDTDVLTIRWTNPRDLVAEQFVFAVKPIANPDDNSDDPVVEAGVDGGDASASGNVLTNDVDPGDTLHVVGLAAGAQDGPSSGNVAIPLLGSYGTLTLNADGSWSYALDQALANGLADGATVEDVFTYTIRDGSGLESTAHVTITIKGSNDGPVAQAATDAAREGGAAISGSVVATDVDDGADLGYALEAAAPAGLSFNADGSYSFDPTVGAYDQLADGASQTLVIGYTATDEHGAASASTLTITVRGTNDGPVAQAVTDAASEGGAAIAGSVVATDVDDGASVSYALEAAAPAGLSFNADGSYSFDPTVGAYDQLADGASQTLVIGYTATDEHGAASASTLTITVRGTNDGPVAQAATDAAREGGAAIAGSVVATDVDDGADLGYALEAAAPAGLSFNADGSYSFDPTVGAYDQLADGASQTLVIGCTATDEHGAASASTLTITVRGTNDGPVAQAVTDAASEGGAAIAGSVVATDVDDGASVSYALEAAAPAGLSFNADGSYSFDPTVGAYDQLADGASQTLVIGYTATDEHGAASASTLTITVRGTNDAPAITSPAIASVAENTAATDVIYTATASDVDGAAPTFSLSGADAALFSIDAGTGELRFLAEPDFEAPADADGDNVYDVLIQANDGVDQTAQALAVTVTDADDAAPAPGIVYFQAYDPAHGAELWSYDGATASFVADIRSGRNDSDPGQHGGFVEFNGDLYFTADDSNNGTELRKFDGTTVSLVKDIAAGSSDSDPGQHGGFVEFDGGLYFTARDSAKGYELHKLEGTTVSLVKDIYAGSNDSYAGEFGGFVEFNGDLYFTADDSSNGTELRKFDGTTVSLVKDIAAGSNDSDPGQYGGFVEFNGGLYFTARDSNGFELRRLDGTTVSLVKDIAAGSNDSYAGRYGGFVEFNDDLYFTARDSAKGYELHKLEGTTGLVSLVADIAAGGNDSYAGGYGGFVEFDGDLYFTARDSAKGFELHKLEGTTGEVSLVDDIRAGGSDSEAGRYGGFVEFDGDLYFTARDSTKGYELHKLDGTTGDVSLVADIHAGGGWATPTDFVVLGDELVFTADDGAGRRLWTYDGTDLNRHSSAIDPQFLTLIEPDLLV